MARGFGKCEDHDIVIEGLNNGSVLGPIVSQIMNNISIVAPHCFLPHWPARVVWTCHKLDEQLVFLGLKCEGVSCPIEELRLQIVCHDRISLHSEAIQHPSLLMSITTSSLLSIPNQIFCSSFPFQLQDLVVHINKSHKKWRCCRHCTSELWPCNICHKFVGSHKANPRLLRFEISHMPFLFGCAIRTQMSCRDQICFAIGF